MLLVFLLQNVVLMYFCSRVFVFEPNYLPLVMFLFLNFYLNGCACCDHLSSLISYDLENVDLHVEITVEG